jgi:pilus assembly protein Flp/PilA
LNCPTNADQSVRAIGSSGELAYQKCLAGRRVEIRSLLKGEISVKDMLLKLYIKARILNEDSGQDLIEYALVVALIAFAATVGMSSVASNINAAFGSIGNKVTSYTT